MMVQLISGLVVAILLKMTLSRRMGWRRTPAWAWGSYLVVAAVALAGCSSPDRYPAEPLSPEDALESFQINEDFRVEVFAAEPHVVDPVGLAFDARGRIFVVELLDFPHGADSAAGQSLIRLLEDTDEDGRIDQSTVFADGLPGATSVLPWKGGLLVTAAPNILYLKDTDGDKKADVREVLFTGFFTGNIEAQITNLRFGIDNWIYASNAGNPGVITSTRQPEVPPVSVQGSDFRFRLDRGRFEAAAGHGRFGQDFDGWGHRFVTHSTIHVRHVVLPEPYLSRNPFLHVTATEDISDHGLHMFQLSAPPYWRIVRTMRRNERYDEAGGERIEYVADHFTGASGGTIYTGHAFPKEYHGNLFTGDVAGNLVHQDVLRPEGATFVASRAEGERYREFLASTDPWFRPVDLEVGPDGNLYVIDMYRLHIETPMSIPEDLKEDMDYSKGGELGRIYRIVPKGDSSAALMPPKVSQLETSELVELLAHPNRWQRITAQRLLLERQDTSAVPLLHRVVAESESPQARLHALYVLEGLSALDATLVGHVLGDPHPYVREHAVRLAERFPELLPQLMEMVEDSSARVVFQVALSLGEFSDESAVNALARIAAQHAQKPWFRKALLSSRAGSSVTLLEGMLGAHDFFQAPDPAKEKFLEMLAGVVGARNDKGEVARLLSLLFESEALQAEAWQVAALSGLAGGLGETEASRLKLSGVEEPLSHLLSSPSEAVQSAASKVAEYFDR